MRIYCLGTGGQELFVKDNCDKLCYRYKGKVEVEDIAPGMHIYPLALAPDLKRQQMEQIRDRGAYPATLIHPTASIATTAHIGSGVLIGANTTIGDKVSIGEGCVIHALCSISHDCHIGPYLFLGPGCHIGGGCIIGQEVFVGIGSILLPHLQIGAGVHIWGGAVVQQSVEQGRTFYVLPQKQPFSKPKPVLLKPDIIRDLDVDYPNAEFPREKEAS